MKLGIVGTHGLPARYGGFETFVSHLATACSEAGISVLIVNEKNNPVLSPQENLKTISSAFNKSEDTLNFYKESLTLASDCDIILCCGVGGSPYFSKIIKSKSKIITNVDGLEHRRKKYTLIQRITIYFLQLFATRRSDLLICDSESIERYWMYRFPNHVRKIKMISYGADECLPFNPSILTKFGLTKNDYFLVIARLVHENNIHEIIKAFKSNIGKRKLVIVGALDDSEYVQRLRRMSTEKILFTDAIYDKEILDTLRQGCFIYLHGHSVGGTNPSLLEAMAASCVCICFESIFNRETTDNTQIYFHSYSDLAIMLNLLEHKKADLAGLKTKALERVRKEYSWDKICASYIRLFQQLNTTTNDS